MKAGILFIWTGCLLTLSLAALHFAYVATPRERLLTLALFLSVICSLHQSSSPRHR